MSSILPGPCCARQAVRLLAGSALSIAALLLGAPLAGAEAAHPLVTDEQWGKYLQSIAGVLRAAHALDPASPSVVKLLAAWKSTMMADIDVETEDLVSVLHEASSIFPVPDAADQVFQLSDEGLSCTPVSGGATPPPSVVPPERLAPLHLTFIRTLRIHDPLDNRMDLIVDSQPFAKIVAQVCASDRLCYAIRADLGKDALISVQLTDQTRRRCLESAAEVCNWTVQITDLQPWRFEAQNVVAVQPEAMLTGAQDSLSLTAQTLHDRIILFKQLPEPKP